MVDDNDIKGVCMGPLCSVSRKQVTDKEIQHDDMKQRRKTVMNGAVRTTFEGV
jgi:hypothetical protein